MGFSRVFKSAGPDGVPKELLEWEKRNSKEASFIPIVNILTTRHFRQAEARIVRKRDVIVVNVSDSWASSQIKFMKGNDVVLASDVKGVTLYKVGSQSMDQVEAEDIWRACGAIMLANEVSEATLARNGKDTLVLTWGQLYDIPNELIALAIYHRRCMWYVDS